MHSRRLSSAATARGAYFVLDLGNRKRYLSVSRVVCDTRLVKCQSSSHLVRFASSSEHENRAFRLCSDSNMTTPFAKQSSIELQQQTSSPPSSREQLLSNEESFPNNGAKTKKPFSFYMTFLALNICVLLVSLDSTALSVAIPVSTCAFPPLHRAY